MQTRDVDVNYAGFYQLGRTNKLVPLNPVKLDADGHVVAGSGTNQVGRYSVHFHRNGVTPTGTPARINGSSVVDSPGWGYTHHDSWVNITDSVSHNVSGAAFTTETGNEIGTWRNNLSIRTIGSDDGSSDRQRHS